MEISLKNAAFSGAAAGIAWGFAAIMLNSLTGAFQFEGSFIRNLASFSFAGALFGLVVAGILYFFNERLPFKGVFMKAVFVSTLLWLLLRAGGAALSTMDAERFHVVTLQSLQGLVLSAVLGVFLGLILETRLREFFA